MESSYLIHSAKGTTWSKKNHKWIRKVNGRYYYDDEADYLEKAKRLDISASAHKKAAEINRKQAEKDGTENQKYEYTFDDQGNVKTVNYSKAFKSAIHDDIAGIAGLYAREYRQAADTKAANRSKGKKLVMSILSRISKESMSVKKSRVKERANTLTQQRPTFKIY